MSAADKSRTENPAGAEDVDASSDENSDPTTRGGQGNAFQINDDPQEPDEDSGNGRKD